VKKETLNLRLNTPRIVIVDRPEPKNVYLLPFEDGEQLLLLGEILNMKGHVVVVNGMGKVYWGYHPDNFREALDSEI
jgi:hypothetical protein